MTDTMTDMMFAIDFDVVDLRVTACPYCVWWWAEFTHTEDGMPVIREWHEATCPEWPAEHHSCTRRSKGSPQWL